MQTSAVSQLPVADWLKVGFECTIDGHCSKEIEECLKAAKYKYNGKTFSYKKYVLKPIKYTDCKVCCSCILNTKMKYSN